MHTKNSRIYLVPGSAGLLVGAGTTDGPTASALLPFSFPRRSFVTGILPLVRGDAPANPLPVVAARMSLTVTDEQIEALVSDGRGTQIIDAYGSLVPSGAGLLLLHGLGFRPWALQRPVDARDIWSHQLQNAGPSNVTMAGIFLFAEVDA